MKIEIVTWVSKAMFTLHIDQQKTCKIHPRFDFQLSFLPATLGSLYQHCFRCITLSTGSLIKRKGLKQATGAYLKTERI